MDLRGRDDIEAALSMLAATLEARDVAASSAGPRSTWPVSSSGRPGMSTFSRCAKVANPMALPSS